MRFKSILFVVTLVCFSVTVVSAQNKKQQQLEAEYKRLLREIDNLNFIFRKEKQKEKSVVKQVEDVNYKIQVQQNLIRVGNDQANQLTRDINKNQREITQLRDQLKELKADYAEMVVKSYKSKSEQSKVMFLLSSENFKQAYKRLQYINQYKAYQKQQAEDIKKKTQDLQKLNLELVEQKKKKQEIVAQNRKVKRQLEQERLAQEKLMALIRKDINRHNAEIRSKQKEASRIDKEINRLIREAITESNTNSGSTNKSSNAFVLTPAGKALSANFVSNKGKLPWPVERGIVKLKFGLQRSLIDKSVAENSFGIRIATEENAKVKAVFNGEVSKILLIKNSNPAILIRHGDYLTIYRNLSKVYVKAGDKVTTGQEIGEVFTNKKTGESLLYFRVNKNNDKLNPEAWLSKN